MKMISATSGCHILPTWYWVMALLDLLWAQGLPSVWVSLAFTALPDLQHLPGQRKQQTSFFFPTSLPGTLKSCITKCGQLHLHCLKQQIRRHIHLHSTAFQVTDSALRGLELLPTDGTLRDHWFAGGWHLCFFHLIQAPGRQWQAYLWRL